MLDQGSSLRGAPIYTFKNVTWASNPKWSGASTKGLVFFKANENQ